MEFSPAWQRGLGENTDGLIRHYFPKGMSLARVGWKSQGV
jgi:IS30 family transposase